jgi:hypothetical protein
VSSGRRIRALASGRRRLQQEIQLTRRAWEDVAPELERLLQRLWDSEANGIPAGFNGLVPTFVQPGDSGHSGLEGDGWASATHEHPVITGAPAGLANTNIEGSAGAIPRLDHQHKRDVRIKLEGADIAIRNALNFEDSPSIDVQVTDDPGNDNVDVTLIVNPAGIIHPVRTETTSYLALLTDEYILGDATLGAMTITLPTVASSVGKLYTVKKIDSTANIVKVDPNGAELIDGAADFDLLSQHEVIEFVCDGTEWWIV